MKILLPWPKLAITLFVATIFLCNCENIESGKSLKKETVLENRISSSVICDTAEMDRQSVKDHNKALAVWLETTSLDWFLEKRQSAWREAVAWGKKILPIDSIPVIKCLSKGNDTCFLYIPNQYYIKRKNGNEFFRFFIVNNSNDSLTLPCIDATIDSISSSVSFISENNRPGPWLSFQETNYTMLWCGNSFWTMKLPPKTMIESEIESDYIGLGDTTVNYRLELCLDNRKLFSNSIKISLMKKQLPYLGKEFD